ncbi:MAG TPA: MBL fold metallo-hydrolase [Pyrinomonadaceae bacterium]|jgi:glyoxylase-like metal-dependent hydrolase (beta-lactamase superfamily II)/rhodanese-related sulfurtransferase
MKFKQFYLGCLSHASYYIGSGEEAAIVDPQRDVEQYLTEAATNGQKIKYVIETHSHADFVSGHIELAAKTGAQIVYGQRANTEFPTLKVKNGDSLTIGKVNLTFYETPGHTPEGICILAENAENPAEPKKLFTGDTLFIGDVGRPDLIGSKGFSSQQMAEMLYDSLHDKILNLPDETEIYPAHGAGSLCGKSLSKETWSTLGVQRRENYALQLMSKAEFVKIVAADQPEVPAYFPKSAAQNLKGSVSLDDLSKPKEMSEEEFKNFKGTILDVRTADEYGAGHLPDSLNIGLGGQFASWAGTLIEIGTPVVIVANSREQIDEAVTRLARVGIETVRGFVLFSNWKGEKAKIEQISVERMNEILSKANDLQFVDVRRSAEFSSGRAPHTMNLPLNVLANEIGKLDLNKPTFVICQGGYRSSAGTSILEKNGFKKLYNVSGGTAAWKNAGLKIEESAAHAV